MQGAPRLHRLPEEPVAAEQLAARRAGRESVARDAADAPVGLGDVQRADLRVEELGEKRERALAEIVDRPVAFKSGAETHLPGPQPRLRLPRPVVARRHHRGADDQDEEQRRAAPRDHERRPRRVLPLLLPLPEEPALRDVDLLGLRVVTLGASSTFGYHDRDDETYPFLLEQALDAQRPATFEVLNMGILHNTSRQILALFEEDVLPAEPDVVIFYEGVNDTVVYQAPWLARLEARLLLARCSTSLGFGAETFDRAGARRTRAASRRPSTRTSRGSRPPTTT